MQFRGIGLERWISNFKFRDLVPVMPETHPGGSTVHALVRVLSFCYGCDVVGSSMHSMSLNLHTIDPTTNSGKLHPHYFSNFFENKIMPPAIS